jgi:hypothetical protein
LKGVTSSCSLYCDLLLILKELYGVFHGLQSKLWINDVRSN